MAGSHYLADNLVFSDLQLLCVWPTFGDFMVQGFSLLRRSSLPSASAASVCLCEVTDCSSKRWTASSYGISWLATLWALLEPEMRHQRLEIWTPSNLKSCQDQVEYFWHDGCTAQVQVNSIRIAIETVSCQLPKWKSDNNRKLQAHKHHVTQIGNRNLFVPIWVPS